MQKHVNLADLVKTQELYNEYLLAKIGFDTAESSLPASQPAENEPFSFHNFTSLQGFNFHGAVVSAMDSSALVPLCHAYQGFFSSARGIGAIVDKYHSLMLGQHFFVE